VWENRRIVHLVTNIQISILFPCQNEGRRTKSSLHLLHILSSLGEELNVVFNIISIGTSWMLAGEPGTDPSPAGGTLKPGFICVGPIGNYACVLHDIPKFLFYRQEL